MRVLAILVVAILLAGCAGSDSPAEASLSGAPESAAPATASADTGGIEGMVVNDEQAPIKGADVGIVQSGAVTQTAVDGGYSFSGLEPGEYTLSVQALGYDTIAKKVKVAAGEITRADVTLKPISLDSGPTLETFHRRGYINCSINPYYSSNLCGNLMSDQAHIAFDLRGDLKLKELVGELVFQSTSGASSKRMELNICTRQENQTHQVNCAEDHLNGDFYVWKSGRSPVVIRTSELPKEMPKLQVTVGAGQLKSDDPEVPLAFQQSFDVYITGCYLEKCPEEFTAVPPPA